MRITVPIVLLSMLALSSAATTASAQTLTVVTWNLDTNQQADTYARGQMDYLAGLSPQILILNEAHKDLWDAGTYTGELQSRTGVAWSGVFAEHCLQASGTTCTAFKGEGVVIVTSLQLADQPSTMISYHCDDWTAGRALGRIAVNFNGTTIQVFGGHIQPNDAFVSSSCPTSPGESYPSRIVERQATANDLMSWASGFSAPRLIGGDFNANPNEAPIAGSQGFTSAYVDAWAAAGSGSGNTFHLTFPNCGTSQLNARIDYWFADNSGQLTATGADTPGLDTCYNGWQSDHVPLRATYSLGSGGLPTVPGRILAANFDNGGEGVSYHDTTPGNTGGACRNTDVDLQVSSEGPCNIGWTQPGEWLNYTVNVTAAGNYTVQLRVATPIGGNSMHVGFNGPSQGTWKTVSIPVTGDWQAWTTVNVPVTLGAGVQQMTILFDTGAVNFEYADVEP